jgi:lysophospholipase L1-like esterase
MRSRKLVIGAMGIAAAITVAGIWQPAFSQTNKPAEAPVQTVPWTGTWAASPQGSGDTFNQQTLRQIVHTSISGTAARIQLSNAIGDQPVTIRNVHIARRTVGSSVDAGSDRTITFNGSATATIPAGGKAVSDAVAFTVDALSDVAISFFVPQPTGGATSHANYGDQTNYVAAGDVAGDATLSNPQTRDNYFFLANLDVQNAAAEGAVVALGASITDGFHTTSDSNRRWTNDLAVRLNQAGRTIGVLNQGISGNGLFGGGGPAAPDRFERDVLAQPNVKWVVFSDDPINDLAGNENAGQRILDATSKLITRAHEKGLKFLCSTLTPFEGAGGWTPTGESGRAAYNAFVRSAGSGCDGIVDQDSATHDPAHPTRFLPSMEIGDRVHPSEAGLQAIANAVNLSLFVSTGGGTPSGGGTNPHSSGVVSLRAQANGKLVTADSAGAEPLIANRDVIGPWEQFDLIDLGNHRVALRAHANNLFVTAANAGAPLRASSATAGTAETLVLINNKDHSVTLRSAPTGKYVCAERAGATALVANRAAIGSWEKFDLIRG